MPRPCGERKSVCLRNHTKACSVCQGSMARDRGRQRQDQIMKGLPAGKQVLGLTQGCLGPCAAGSDHQPPWCWLRPHGQEGQAQTQRCPFCGKAVPSQSLLCSWPPSGPPWPRPSRSTCSWSCSGWTLTDADWPRRFPPELSPPCPWWVPLGGLNRGCEGPAAPSQCLFQVPLSLVSSLPPLGPPPERQAGPAMIPCGL